MVPWYTLMPLSRNLRKKKNGCCTSSVQQHASNSNNSNAKTTLFVRQRLHYFVRQRRHSHIVFLLQLRMSIVNRTHEKRNPSPPFRRNCPTLRPCSVEARSVHLVKPTNKKCEHALLNKGGRFFAPFFVSSS